MENNTSRFNPSNIIAACIIAVGLMTSARILAQRPTMPSNTVSMQSVSSVPPLASPPLSQETIKTQVRAQTLAASNLQTYRYNGAVYKLSDVTVSQVSYSAKDDNFTVILNWVWQPGIPLNGPQQSVATLSNNGYNQYVGTVLLDRQYADICVK